MFKLWLIIITTLLSIARYVKFRLDRKRLEELIEKFPGPPAFPFIGNAYLVFGTTKEIARRKRNIEAKGSPTRLWMLHKPFVLIYDPDNFQIVANKTLEKATEYKLMHDLLGEGLITANGSKWKRNRRLLNPAFNVNLMKSFFLDVFNEHAYKLVKTLGTEDGKEEFDLWPHVFKCTRDIICMTAMGYQDEFEDEVERENFVTEYGKTLERASAAVIERLIKPWLHPDLLFYIYSRITGGRKALKDVRSLPLQIIRKKREERKNDDSMNSEEKNLKNFIDILFESEIFRNSDDEELASEVVTFLLTGSESSAITMCFMLLMLAKHVHYQDLVYEELHNIFGDSDRPPQLDDLNRLPIMERCIKETLRKFPPAPMILRNVTEDIKLKDGRILPAGCTAFLSIVSMHSSKEYYDNPYEWNPDRFLPEEVEKRHPGCFVPFSAGPRICIGAKYAMLNVKAQLSTILRFYEFRSDIKISRLQLSFDIALRNKSGFPVRLTRRKRNPKLSDSNPC